MEELLELRQLLEAGKMSEAMLLLDEMDELAKDDKINKIESHLVILLLHLIKQQAENRTTRSWNLSISNSTRGVVKSWRRRKTGGYYLTSDELIETISEAFPEALRRAALEAFDGKYTERQLTPFIDIERVKGEACRRLFAPEKADDDTDTDIPQWLK